jgi:DNA-binding LacI/PurR family transcriptional regulator
MVVQYLLTVGSERIGYWGPRDQTDSAQHALANFMQACAKRSMPCMVGLVDRPVESADEIVRQWMPFNKRTVIYCYDDQSALRLLTSLHKHGIRIPQQVGIIGHNDTDICSFTDPPLTSTRFPFDYVARAMLHYASTWARDGHPTRMAETAIPKLMVRKSCGGELLLGMQFQDAIDQINHANRGNFHIQLQESAT